MKRGTFLSCNLSKSYLGDDNVYVNFDFGKRLRYVGGIKKEIGNLL